MVAALQWVPFTGIFLMFLMAPLWSIVLINAGFLAMTFEAIVGMIPRWAVAIPLVYFGGYCAEAVVQHREVDRQIATLASKPAGHLKFDANEAVINVDLFGDEIGHDLIAFYHVPAVIRGGIGQDGLADVYRLKPECKLARAGISSTPSHNEFLQRSLNFDPCIVKHREVYSGLIVNIKSAEQGKRVRDTVNADRIVLTATDGNQVTIDNGWYSPLSWFPMPIIGCGLNDEPPAWKCVAHFNHDRIPVLTPIDGVSGPAAAVARVLGLERKT